MRMQGAGGIGGVLAYTDSRLVTPASFYYHADGNGTITALIDDGQRIAARYLYDSFGIPLSASGSQAFVNPIWFSSHFYDWDTGFLHYKYRVYIPQIQRWLSKDPMAAIGERLRLFRVLKQEEVYMFVGNNPISFIDPYGLWTWYGNWGGPDWTGGYPGSWEDVLDNGIDPLPPIDKQDEGYEKHDKCFANCRDDFRQAAANGHWKSGKLELGKCLRKCDRDLSKCLKNLGDDPSNDCHAKIGGCVLGALGKFGHVFPSDPAPRESYGR